jgi:hypothetical protein
MALLLAEVRELQRHFKKSKAASELSSAHFNPFAVTVLNLHQVLGGHELSQETNEIFKTVFHGAIISACCMLPCHDTPPCADAGLEKRMQAAPAEVAKDGLDGVQSITLTMLSELIKRIPLDNLAIGSEAGFHIDMPIVAHGLQDKVALLKQDSEAFRQSHAPKELVCFTLPVPVLGGWEDKGLRDKDGFTVNEQAEALAGFKGFVDANRSHMGACNRLSGLLIGVRADKKKKGGWKETGRHWMCQPFLYFRDIEQGTDHYLTCAPAIGTETAILCVSWWLGEAMRRGQAFSKQMETMLQGAKDADTCTLADSADGEGDSAASPENHPSDADAPDEVASSFEQMRLGLAGDVLQNKENFGNPAIGWPHSLHTKTALWTSAVEKQSCVPSLPTDHVIQNFMAGRVAGVYSR